MSHLDTGQCLTKLRNDWSHFFHSAWEADLFAVVIDLSNRRNDSGSTAKTTFCKIFYFIEVYFTFFNFQSKIFLCNIDQRTTSDRWQDTV